MKRALRHRPLAAALAMSVSLVALVSAAPAALAQDAPSLEQGFDSPPESARPRVWWHWLSGNITREGITLDLEWMKRVGIGGMQMFDGELGEARIVEHRIPALTPEWRDHLAFAAEEAERLDLEFAMAAAPGWSETGGPWIQPQQAMKKYVWAETRVQGGRPFRTPLNAPPSNSGPFQDMPLAGRNIGGAAHGPIPSLYRDVAVLAYPAPTGDVTLASLNPTVTYSGGADLAIAGLTDGTLVTPVALAAPTPEAPTWVQFAFEGLQTMRALTYAGPVGGRFATGPQGGVEVSDDGQTWRRVAVLTGYAHNPSPQRTLSFPATTGRYFRVVFDTPQVPQGAPRPAQPITVTELALVPGARVNAFEDKAAFGVAAEYETLTTPDFDAGAAIDPEAVVDLTDRLRPDGTVDWTPPAGDWVVLRFGYSLTGTVNHPASPEATGLEVDKLNGDHVRAHLDGYIGPVIERLGDDLIGEAGLRYLLTDSWEAGDQNWTERMPEEFEARRGYSLMRYLPALTGRVVGDSRTSDRFLWDFRRTVADMVATEHYGTITEYAREHGFGYYGEAMGASWPTTADGMQAKAYTDIPMGEFWALDFGEQPAAFHGLRSDEFPADIIETASTAHLYGKPLVAAEALTSSQPLWTATPWKLKWVADKYMAMGVNRLVIHTSPHQPGRNHQPGLSLGAFTQMFTRNETWGELAKPWIDYLSRTSFMLQQGTNVADVLYFYGEGAPSSVPYREPARPALPEGYGFDYTNASALLDRASVRDGRIVFEGGASFALLILPDAQEEMTLPLLTKIARLVEAGGVVLGPRPQRSPSLGSEDDAVRALADRVWGPIDGRLSTRATYGLGRVYSGVTPEAVLEAEGLVRDYDYAHTRTDDPLRFSHRRTGEGDVYFVTNQTGESQRRTVSFRTVERTPSLWFADTGDQRPVAYRRGETQTEVDLDLAPYEAAFVVFNGDGPAAQSLAPAAVRPLGEVEGAWQVAFQPGRLAPETMTLPTLTSWTESADAGVRYFSGLATYTRTIDAPRAWFRSGERIYLDLGQVGEVAEISLNGEVVGSAWKPPYALDVTDALRPGRNEISIRVANTWLNRFIGDLQPGVTEPVAFSNVPPATGGGFANIGRRPTAETALTPSGLIGPVTFQARTAPETSR